MASATIFLWYAGQGAHQISPTLLKRLLAINWRALRLGRDCLTARQQMNAEEADDLTQHARGARDLGYDNITSQKASMDDRSMSHSRAESPARKGYWKTSRTDGDLIAAHRIECSEDALSYVRFLEISRCSHCNNIWTDTGTENRAGRQNLCRSDSHQGVQRCLLMTTDPGDLVLDPTCGSGTTAYVAEQWGRRWITCDTSRVALALARTRLMAGQFPYYLSADSPEGIKKDADLTGQVAAKDLTVRLPPTARRCLKSCISVGRRVLPAAVVEAWRRAMKKSTTSNA